MIHKHLHNLTQTNTKALKQILTLLNLNNIKCLLRQCELLTYFINNFLIYAHPFFYYEL